MKDKIEIYQLFDMVESSGEDEKRLAMCWNILRTCTDEQLIVMERQVDKILEETKETGLVVGVNIGPELPF